MCDNIYKTISEINDTTRKLQDQNISHELTKLDKEYFHEWKDKTEDLLNTLLDRYQKTQSKRDKLENWIEIYMPLKLQHQITETLRVCLYDKKSRHMLGIVDDIIQKYLR